jgi:hypothetical protein
MRLLKMMERGDMCSANTSTSDLNGKKEWWVEGVDKDSSGDPHLLFAPRAGRRAVGVGGVFIDRRGGFDARLLGGEGGLRA